jgi:hypothetical protein
MQTQRFVPWSKPLAIARGEIVASNPHGVVWRLEYEGTTAVSYRVVQLGIRHDMVHSNHITREAAMDALNEIVRTFWHGVSLGGPAVNVTAAREHLARIHPSPRDNSIREERA